METELDVIHLVYVPTDYAIKLSIQIMQSWFRWDSSYTKMLGGSSMIAIQ